MKLRMMAAAAAVLVSGCSTGPTADAQFVAALGSHGIPGDRGVEIGAAHQVCDVMRQVANQDKTPLPPPLSENWKPSGWVAEMGEAHNRLTGQGLSNEQFMQFMLDSVDAFCPEARDKLREMYRENDETK